MAKIDHITSAKNPYIKRLVDLRTNSAARNAAQRTVVAGASLVRELCGSSNVCALLATEASLLDELRGDAARYLVSPEVMARVTGLPSPPTLAAEVALPKTGDLSGAQRIVALDRIADPGNAGTILRTSLAFGWDGAFISDSCVDPFNDKVLRSSRGALFRMPFTRGPASQVFEGQATVLIADTSGTPATEVQPAGPICLVLSNEARGPDAFVLRRGTRITLPMKGPMESLNVAVAAGILLFLLGS